MVFTSGGWSAVAVERGEAHYLLRDLPTGCSVDRGGAHEIASRVRDVRTVGASSYRRLVPTHLHETLIELFRARPALAAELLGGVLGVEAPLHEQARADPADLPDLLPTEYRADAVVVLTHDEEPVMAVVVEVQLRRDGDKRWSWPVYVTTLRARLRCPVELLVICPDAGIAGWCVTPIRLGASGSQVTPLVLGPELVPLVTDPEQAAQAPELTVLSALAQRRRPEASGGVDGAAESPRHRRRAARLSVP